MWKATRTSCARPRWNGSRRAFPAAEAKPLYFDAKSGIATLLMKFEPGAVLPDHEHVMVEQTYVISGTLVDKEGPARGPRRSAPASSFGASPAAVTRPGRRKAAS